MHRHYLMLYSIHDKSWAQSNEMLSILAASEVDDRKWPTKRAKFLACSISNLDKPSAGLYRILKLQLLKTSPGEASVLSFPSCFSKSAFSDLGTALQQYNALKPGQVSVALHGEGWNNMLASKTRLKNTTSAFQQVWQNKAFKTNVHHVLLISLIRLQSIRHWIWVHKIQTGCCIMYSKCAKIVAVIQICGESNKIIHGHGADSGLAAVQHRFGHIRRGRRQKRTGGDEDTNFRAAVSSAGLSSKACRSSGVDITLYLQCTASLIGWDILSAFDYECCDAECYADSFWVSQQSAKKAKKYWDISRLLCKHWPLSSVDVSCCLECIRKPKCTAIVSNRPREVYKSPQKP